MAEWMMRLEGVGKQYTVGGSRGQLTLRESLLETLRAPFTRTATQDFWALRDATFDVAQGEVLGVIGRNGAGKSTLLRILARITPPTTGKVTLRGRVGSLLEVGAGFHPELTGRENVFLNGAILGMSAAEIRATFDSIVDFAEVAAFIDTPVKRYSSGMYMRLAFAVAAHLHPEILLVDEVLAVGDAQFQKKCLGKMSEVSRSGRTVVFVSHNLGAISALCDSCIWLDQGAIKARGPAREIVDRYLGEVPTDTDVVIRKEQHVRGSQEVRIDRMSLQSGGASKSELLIGDPVELVLDYEVHPDFKTPISFWVIVSTSDGAPLVSSFQKDGGTFTPTPGKHRMRVSFADLGLLPGTFFCSAGVFQHQAGIHSFVDWVENAMRFSISPAFAAGQPFDNRWGIVNRPATWQPEA